MPIGRPPRNKFDRQRTKFWAASVFRMAEIRGQTLEEALGADGRWQDVWARYWRGTVSPSKTRLARVEATFPGTRNTYESPVWTLWSKSEWSWASLLKARFDLGPYFQQAFDHEDDLRNEIKSRLKPGNKIKVPPTTHSNWHTAYFFGELLTDVMARMHEEQHELDALGSLLLILYESWLVEDRIRYFCISVLWAIVERQRHERPILRLLPRSVFEEPLRWHTKIRRWPDELGGLEIEMNRAKHLATRAANSGKFDALTFLQSYFGESFNYLNTVYLRQEAPPVTSGTNLELWPLSKE